MSNVIEDATKKPERRNNHILRLVNPLQPKFNQDKSKPLEEKEFAGLSAKMKRKKAKKYFKSEANLQANVTAALSYNAFGDWYNLVCEFLNQHAKQSNRQLPVPAMFFAKKAFEANEHPRDYANRLYKGWTE